MLFTDVVRASETVRATRSRKTKIAALAELLSAAQPDELAAVVAWVSGELRQGRIGTGWRTLTGLGETAADTPTLTAARVDEVFGELAATSGPGSANRRKHLLSELWRAATADEQAFLLRLLTGELRQGALTAVVTEAVARAADVPLELVRRAYMLSGKLPVTAIAALTGGEAALREFRLEVGRPIQPMLASPGAALDDALAEFDGAVSVEHKLDGARIQVHRDGDRVWVFTRTLRDITANVPELVELVAGLNCTSVVLDGETLALTDTGRPRPFQETMARFASADPGQSIAVAPPDGPGNAAGSAGPDESAASSGSGSTADSGGTGDSDGLGGSEPTVPTELRPMPTSTRELLLHPYFFDCLHLDGRDLLDEPLLERRAALTKVAGEHSIPALIRPDAEAAAEYFDGALASGHEGVMIKSLDAPYAAGRRGRSWLKIKPTHTLDLLVLGAEWGYGRRTGYLSNLHLGARDPESGEPVMVGKTFKGLTDALLHWQTAEFPRHERTRDQHTVYLWPELVVEIALDGVQTSTRYPGGVALRFARVVRYRPDKTPDQADTIDTVRALLP
ncbi:ATP-dependent DNA ligase [Nocardia cyriacigeorgica]|uniref:ATP-dependent DNA ligase n=1 Tax=Nocardia cyriacigeorgica TaxID=135487 RepID=UPI0018954CC9|nr:ATP-dependent DNA ligase [Nocardia cyriacigeorgica]MBF6085602.1 ATP-dependent DNA ligase [Nocardia cyriacigeorgica]MBF6091691.1 ATP-dependent DNA ligase [Nocardia cyriacigeorgica]MBF6394673.1 ATP-dependent DNA ligase [Nocardia cyriacigeorgica]MBF6400307.1 ATP-dependent DNA ligase [Nocardia cyriacigeorgica]